MNPRPVNKLVVEDYPLLVVPRLAVAIGLNEAIFVQQLHYWIRKSSNEYDDQLWVYNTIEDWLEQFPFWSASTLRRITKSLRDQGVVVATDEFNRSKSDRRLWYTLDYSLIGELTMDIAPVEPPMDDDPMLDSVPNGGPTQPDPSMDWLADADPVQPGTELEEIEDTMNTLADSINDAMANLAPYTRGSEGHLSESSTGLLNMNKPVVQNEQVELTKSTNGLVKVSNPVGQSEQVEPLNMNNSTIYTEITSETSSETSNNNNAETRNGVVVVSESLRLSLEKYGIPGIMIDKWVDRYGEPYMEEKVALLEVTIGRKGVANPHGFLMEAIKNNWTQAPSWRRQADIDPTAMSQEERRAKYIPEEFSSIIKG